MARFTVAIPARWSDMDAYGHINNARYLTLFEEARTLMIAGAGSTGLTLLDGVFVTRHEIGYRRQVAWHREPLQIQVWISQRRHATFTVAYELFDPAEPSEVAAHARTVMAPIDRSTGRPRRLSPAERGLLGGWLEPAER